MKIRLDHTHGCDEIEVGGLTITGAGIFSGAGQIVEFVLVNGQLALKDIDRDRLLGSLSVK